MHERNSQSVDGGLFADKGGAEPTRDFVPRLKTDEPAKLEAPAAISNARPEAEPLPDANGLMGGLIRRRTDPQQDLPPPDQTAVEAARHFDPEAAEFTKTVSEHIDNGMLYESLKMGLPLPKLGKALTNADEDEEEPRSFGEAARQRVVRPTTREPSGSAPTAHANRAGSKGRHAHKAVRGPKRHQLTARLSVEDFERLKAYAESSGRTYQDILSSATASYLDLIALGPKTFASPAMSSPDPQTVKTGASARKTTGPIELKSQTNGADKT
jgi:hypothetical protein